jgi:GalNAc5-diNAcBac-PP-undecaprenol beta-1,3-glucosyltransferase
MNPKITIILATYNRAHLIAETLLSIQNQTYENFECLITDDNSTDNTKEVVEAFCEMDCRFQYYLKPGNYPQGLSATRNFGLDLTKSKFAKYIQFFDDDDIMHPEKLQKQMQVFVKDPDAEIVNCKFQGFRGSLNIESHIYTGTMNIESDNLATDFLLGEIRINSLGPIFRAELLKDIRFDTDFKYTAEEREFYLRLFFLKKPVYKAVNEFLFFYRHHAVSITSSSKNRMEKLGTHIYLNEKLWDFLIDNNLMTRRTLAYFTKRFLLDHYSTESLLKIKEFIRKTDILGSFSKRKLLAVISTQYYYRKLIYKILQ